MTHMQLAYDIQVGLQPLTSFSTEKIGPASAALPMGELALLGMTFNAVVLTNPASGVVRATVRLDVDAQGELNFPTDAEKIYATRALYAGEYAYSLACEVTSLTPVVVH